MATIRLFEQTSHARLYSKYRPTYPKALLEIISCYLSRNGCGNDLAVDVGCGSGQSTFQLGECFSRCVGVDISRAQVLEAQKKCEDKGVTQNFKFVEGDGGNLPVDSSSVNAVTIAQAWHWLPDHGKFYSECKRVLRPGGCLAVYGYGNVQLLDNSCDALVRRFYADTLKGCWHKERVHIDNEYSEVDLPLENTERHDIEMPKSFSMSDFIGYLSTWSGYQKFTELHPTNTELQVLEERLCKLLPQGSDSEVILETRFPVFLILGQKVA